MPGRVPNLVPDGNEAWYLSLDIFDPQWEGVAQPLQSRTETSTGPHRSLCGRASKARRSFRTRIRNLAEIFRRALMEKISRIAFCFRLQALVVKS